MAVKTSPKTRLYAWSLPCNLTPTGLQTTGSQLISRPFVFLSFLFKHVLGPRLQHAFRPRLPRYFRIKDVMHSGRTGCTLILGAVQR